MTSILGICFEYGEDVRTIRNILHYKGIQFTKQVYGDEVVPRSKMPHFESMGRQSRDPECQQFEEIINLPFFIDDDLLLTCGKLNIIHHIGEKYHLIGTNPDELRRVGLAEKEAKEMIENWDRLMQETEIVNHKLPYTTELKMNLRRLSDILKDEDWFSGKTLTYVDFMLYEIIITNQLIHVNLLEVHGNLQNFLKRFEKIRLVYLSSERNGPTV